MFFIGLFLANTWEKNRMDNLLGGDWGEIQNNAHRVRSMHSRSSLFSVVFMCLISPTQKYKLEKSTINTKEWGKSKFHEILKLWIFILDYFVAPAFCLIPVSLGFCFCAMFDKETWRKDFWFLFFICLLCLVSIYSKMWIQQQTSCLHQRLLVSLACFRCYSGLLVSLLSEDKLSQVKSSQFLFKLTHRIINFTNQCFKI